MSNIPRKHGATPSPRQLKWHDMEYYGFIHFTVNTFTDKEWGYGDEPESVFNPVDLDCRQWARIAKEAGMKGLVLTAKHHDGFCLWPSKYTEHSVKNSPWKNGKGDVCRELSEACKEYGLKLGFYNSPWDRNHAQYATDAYVDYFHKQWEELLTNYGKLFEVWLDGANGGDGFYGGAREKRNIDAKTYYKFNKLYETMHRLQPDASIFGAEHTDARWIGNESGYASLPHWAKSSFAENAAPTDNNVLFEKLGNGYPDGPDWWPAETDVSIRPGWFFHPNEEPHSLEKLKGIYWYSVCRGTNLILNITPDRRGLIPEQDEKRLIEFGDYLKGTFKNDIAAGKEVTASNTRGNLPEFSANNLTDGKPDTYWCTDDGTTTATLEIKWKDTKEVIAVRIDEHIELGQRIEEFSVDCNHWSWMNGMAIGKTVGSRSILQLPNVPCNGIRIRILKSQACPVIKRISVYTAQP